MAITPEGGVMSMISAGPAGAPLNGLPDDILGGKIQHRPARKAAEW